LPQRVVNRSLESCIASFASGDLQNVFKSGSL
jgi:hypothetical protein